MIDFCIMYFESLFNNYLGKNPYQLVIDSSQTYEFVLNNNNSNEEKTLESPSSMSHGTVKNTSRSRFLQSQSESLYKHARAFIR